VRILPQQTVFVNAKNSDPVTNSSVNRYNVDARNSDSEDNSSVSSSTVDGVNNNAGNNSSTTHVADDWKWSHDGILMSMFPLLMVMCSV